MFAIALALSAAFPIVADPEVFTHKDPISDAELIGAGWESSGSAIVVTCVPAKKALKVLFRSGSHSFGKTGLFTASWKLTYRFDSDRPVVEDWYHSDADAETLGSKQTATFIRGLATSKVVVIRATSDFGRGEKFDTRFEIGNAKPALSKVISACGSTKVSKSLSDVLEI